MSQSKLEERLLFLRLTREEEPAADPAWSLAAEEYLLDEPAAADSLPVFLLYENRESLIIGKNQNPWKEIDPEVLRLGSAPFCRRISGGGTVWHGPGNLNFSFIQNRGDFSKEGNLDFVRRALARLGVFAQRTERGDIVCGGKKVSGNALAFRRGRVLHHGTLLVDAPLERLRGCLPAFPPAIETRAVASFPLPVANLKDFAPGVTAARAAEALLEEARASFGTVEIPENPEALFPPAKLEALARRHGDPDWLYGATPVFTYSAKGEELTVQGGVITRVTRGGAECPGDSRVGKGFSLPLS
ncbi:MAG: lipoate--protein ligase family protein [Spirochaetaceae bacterium]|nr:lipoate--protein ligase family protein [Spirochaetaceae bacterium]